MPVTYDSAKCSALGDDYCEFYVERLCKGRRPFSNFSTTIRVRLLLSLQIRTRKSGGSLRGWRQGVTSSKLGGKEYCL
ncbi:MAG: hypothetical protein ACTSWP_07795 [Candidatus Freyarchaeota archaeon]